MHFIESCMLHLTGYVDQATLVHDSYKLGSYRFDEVFNLRHSTQAPAATFDVAEDDIVRAYKRLFLIQADQSQRGTICQRKAPQCAQGARRLNAGDHQTIRHR